MSGATRQQEKMKKIKPINLLDTCPLRPEKPAVVDAVREVLTLARVTEAVSLHDYGRWRHERWRTDDNGLVPFLSVDWYVASAWDQTRMQVNGEILMELMAEEPWRRAEMLGDHYDIILLDEDLYTCQPDWPDDFIVAIARPKVGTAISTFRLGAYPFTVLKTVAMHELGHVFGVPGRDRKDVDRTRGAHCGNRCIMRYPEKTPEDWEAYTWDRFKYGPFCENCMEDLRRYFRAEENPPEEE